MKIISKYKDYYDYLSGIYGIDEKIVLDRTNSKNSPNVEFCTRYSERMDLYIAGYIIEGLYIDGKFYYGDDLKQFEITKNERRNRWLSTHEKRDYKKSITIRCNGDDFWIYTEPVKDMNNTNIKYKCPIIFGNSDYKRIMFPILENFGLSKFIKPEVIYGWLYEYLSNRISDTETSVELDNKNKILSKGFDLKTSFRNIK